MQARAYQESVAASDWPEADRAWLALLGAGRSGYGLDMDDPASLPDTAGLPLPELRKRVPGALPNLLYLRALHRLNGSVPERLSDVEPLLRAATRTAHDLTAALRPLAAEDQVTVGVERTALALVAASLADRADPGAIATATAADPARATAIARRCFVGLVNAGRTDLARKLEGREDLDAAALDARGLGQPLDVSERDTLFCLGMLELAPDGDAALARRRFARVREAGPHSPLYWPALRGECIAADHQGDTAHTTALLATLPVGEMPEDLRRRHPIEAARPPPTWTQRLSRHLARGPRRLFL